MDTNVITVTRQFGSLGRQIARQVAERLGYEYYDRDIIEMAAVKLGKDVEELLDYDGHIISPYKKMMAPLGYGIASKQKKLFEIEQEIILDLAKKKNCVIVGRCSDYILTKAQLKHLFNVFIYAPYGARYNFCVQNLGLTTEAVEDYMNRVGNAREAFYKKQTGYSFESVKYRHLMVDSSSMPMPDVVDLICEGAKKKFSR